MRTVMMRDVASCDYLLDFAGRLEPKDQLRLLERLAAILRQQLDVVTIHTINELRGLGKELEQRRRPAGRRSRAGGL
jgi:CRISPR/Cas system-associated endoribonuclease Cas2